jgi:hypothetical protein
MDKSQGNEHEGKGGGHEDQPGGHHGGDHHPDTVTIVVNGKAKKVAKHAELTFWEVVKLAFENPQTGDGIQYTVQYTRGHGHKPSSTLVEGQTVRVKDGMEFDVTPTNRS